MIDEQAALKWLAEKWPSPQWCPVCGHADHWLGDLGAVPGFEYEKWIINTPQFPVFGIVCRNCGHVMWFSAILAGVMPPKPERKPEPMAAEGVIEAQVVAMEGGGMIVTGYRCGRCGEEFTTNCDVSDIECPECGSHRCEHCGMWSGS